MKVRELTGQHVHVGTVGDGEDVGGDFISPLALVDLDDTRSVDGVTLVWVDSDAEETGVGVDELDVVTLPQVVQDRGVVKVGQVGHVLAFFEFGGVHLLYQILLEVLGLATWDTNGDEVTLGALDLTKDETFLLAGDPAGLLGIVRLGLVNTLLFERNVQEFCGIGVGTGTLDNMARHVGGFIKK